MFQPADDASWAIAEGRTSEHPFQIRFRDRIALLERSLYAKRLNVFYSMRRSDAHGMAIESELDDLHIFENRLVPAVEQDESAMLVAVITGRGEREFVFYVQDPQLFLKHLSEMPQEAERYPIEIHAADDSEWTYFDALLPAGTDI